MSSIGTVIGSTVLWSALSTLLVTVPGVFVAYALARREFQGKNVLSTLIGLPLVLPPTAVGYLILRLLADGGPLGRETLGFDLNILLTWKAVVVGCAVMSMPLIIRTARVGFEEVDPRLESMARTLGYSPLKTFATITLPLAGRALIAAVVLGFTRAMGEFGATVTLAGSIPGRTQTLASAIFAAQQAGDESRANVFLAVALVLGFVAIYTTERLSRSRGVAPGGRP